MDSDAITDFDREVEESLKRVDQEQAAMRRDAERYRKLKTRRVNPYAVLPCGAALDEHIDAWN